MLFGIEILPPSELREFALYAGVVALIAIFFLDSYLPKFPNSERIRMTLAGLICTVASYSVYVTVLGILGERFYLLAMACDFVAYTLLNFRINYRWSYKGVSPTQKRRLLHLAMLLLNGAAQGSALYYLVEKGILDEYYAQLVVQLVTGVLGWLATHMIFRRKRHPV